MLCANLTAQLSKFEVEELKESNYYSEALTAILKKKKELTAGDYAELGVLAYNIHDYKKSNEFFSHVGSDFTMTQEQKKVYFEILRITEQYDKSKSNIPVALSADNSVVSNFVNFPLGNTKVDENITLEKSTINFGRTFMGMAIDNNNFLLTKSISNKSKVRDLYQYNFDGTDILAGEKKIKSAEDDFIYRANPTFFTSNEYIYTKSIVDYKTYKVKKADKKVKNNLLKLFKYNKETEKEEALVAFNSDQTNSVTPFYWKEENILFYSVSNAENENYDIFYSKNNEGSWGAPVKLSGINTRFNEVYPFVYNGNLYFSSRGHKNYGGLDLFSIPIKIEGGSVVLQGTPQNMGKPINSSYDDFSLTYTSDSTGYFASNREGVEGADELYKFIARNPIKNLLVKIKDTEGFVVNEATLNLYELDENGNKSLIGTYSPDDQGELQLPMAGSTNYGVEVTGEDYFPNNFMLNGNDITDEPKTVLLREVLVVGKIEDDITNLPLKGTEVGIYELKNGEYVLVETLTSDENGKWEYPFNRNKEYKVNFEKRDYKPTTFYIPTNKDKNRGDILTKLSSIKSEPLLKKDDVVQLQNITFDFGSAELTAESIKILDNVVRYLKSNPDVKIELSAHTDCESGYLFNMRLSNRRAKSAYNYIVSKGIKANRMTRRGYGEKYILNGCLEPGQCSKEKNRENRRVEIKIK